MSAQRPVVLVADDDAVVRKGYGLRMRAMGWDVTLAKDGYETLKLARDREYDAILLDLRMPYRTGAEILKTLRTDGALGNTLVYLLASPGDGALAEQAMRHGADGIFEKSRNGPRSVIAELETVLESRAGSQPGPEQSVSDAVAAIAKRFRKSSSADDAAAQRPARPQRTTTPGPSTSRKPSGSLPGTYRSTDNARRTSPFDVTGRSSAERERETVRTPSGFPVFDRRPGRSPFDRVDHDGVQSARVQPQREPPRSTAPKPEPPRQADPPSVRAPTDPIFVHRTAAEAPKREFDIVINRFVGEARQLADQVGVPPDYLCPVCSSQLVLRLSTDPRNPGGVKGHFLCSRCTPE